MIAAAFFRLIAIAFKRNSMFPIYGLTVSESICLLFEEKQPLVVQ
jgi:hypothetical protein